MTTKTTTTKTTTKPKKTFTVQEAIETLPTNPFVFEILELASKFGILIPV
jgi:hypothetical protein